MASLCRTGLNLNTGEAWTAVDDADLRSCFKEGGIVSDEAIMQAADFLCRNEQEVRDRLRELGYTRSPDCRNAGR